MTTVRDVYDFLDTLAPFSTQLSFDNSGLLVGDADAFVRHIGVCLDVTPATIDEASEAGVDLMVTHHPVLFKPRKKLVASDPAYLLVQRGIHAIATHTCFDIASGGVNDVLCSLLSLSRVEAVTLPSSPATLVRVGFLPEKMRAVELAAYAAEALSARVRWCDGGKAIETLAVCGGAGGDLVEDISSIGVDALLTGDAGYHDFLDAEQLGLTLIAAGHFETENPAMPALCRALREHFPQLDVTLLHQKKTIQHI